MSALDEAIAVELAEVIEVRHDLHAHPELMYKEERTSKVVQAQLEKAGVQFTPGLAGGTGVLGWLPATGDPNKAETVALRADMDALPIEEETGKAYSSKHPGVMHACGHDGHTSVLIGVARVLAKMKERPNNVLFLFQPAEEGGAGGRRMCEDGVLAGKVLGKPADIIFGLHGFPNLEVGKMTTRTGPLLASTDEFHVEIVGQGGHAAQPHVGVDPIVVASHIVVALQTIASRNIDPLDSIVVTVGMFHAGTAKNIIPNTAMIKGTLRTLRAETREKGRERIKAVAEQIAAAFGARADVQLTEGYPVTQNETCATDRFRAVAKQAFGENLLGDCPPVMGGEDFSFYGAHCPACFYFIGVKPKGMESYPNLHTPDFDFNDDAIPVGMKAMCELALSYA
jgi:amidohydrolase